MKKLKQIFFFLCFLYFSLQITFAQEGKEKIRKHQFSLQVDNDALAFTHFDRYYTHGVFLAYSHYLSRDSRLHARISQQIYTPEKYTSEDIRIYDRPYAGVLFGEVGYQYLMDRGWLRGDLLLGKIGPGSKAEDVQVWYHTLFGFPQPKGWKYQIQSGGLVNLKLQAAFNVVRTRKFEFWLQPNVAMGNYDRSLGLTPSIRIGKFNTAKNSFISGSRVGRSARREAYFQAGVHYKRVYWNATLQGTSESSAFDLATMDPIKSVSEYFAQLVVAYPKVGFAYRFFYRTQETTLAEGQLLGSLYFYYTF
ncbi:lipid A deacylase LpxR family protein [Echinicola strongylocentroti]|uniref:Lipid A deacylase LpxR family protein n=1 Tax=Echinicola strongylocentroti TaxID=1795355 RepID=A0A2Z4IGJ1_9BACT|nr:lipid A deacylase LpxR family protein [Echinicola strongylocentroti]AWW30094.1 lipid A deacylase LpxR family protein [Echinicola strongylocentroti]